MPLQALRGVSLAVALWCSAASAQEIAFRPVRAPAPGNDTGVTLGRPRPLAEPLPRANTEVAAFVPVAPYDPTRPTFRGQIPEVPPVNVPGPPPPPPFPGGSGGVAPRGPSSTEEAYNCGLVNNDADRGGFFTRCGERFRRCWTDVSDSVSGGGQRGALQCDHTFDYFISPVSNPVYFEDPRALTELRPIFIWQRTPSANPVFAGGTNYVALLQGRLAVTDSFSIVLNKFGWVWANPEAPAAPQGNGFSELHVGPKWTFLRSDVTKTVAAVGMNFEIAIGSARVGQDTGDLSLSPYFSFAQSFCCSSYGSFNFMNTTGYSFGIDSQRTDFAYTSLHLDYGFQTGWLKGFYPLVELNAMYYTNSGAALPFNFEGNNLFNFGSTMVSGHNDVTLAVGFRYKFSEAVQFGITGEKSITSGARHMDDLRFTVDMIFRY